MFAFVSFFTVDRKMKRFWSTTRFCFGVFILFLCGSDATSLMRRIRDQQNIDGAPNRGLGIKSEDWVYIPQPIQNVLMSIDDKLHSLDTFSYTLKLARLDFSLDQLVKRLENIETKIGRLETNFDLRMEKVEEVIISKDLKEEFSNEHLSRRMENLNEKINNKAAYLDAKLDIKLERIANKLDLLERDLHSSYDDVLERLVKNEERFVGFETEIAKKGEKFDIMFGNVNEIRIFLKEDLGGVLINRSNDLKQQMDDLHVKFQDNTLAIVSSCNSASTSFNESLSNLLRVKKEDIPSSDRHRSLGEQPVDASNEATLKLWANLSRTIERTVDTFEVKFEKLDSDVSTYAKKIVNGVQELWKSTDHLKLDFNKHLDCENRTQNFIRVELQRLYEDIDLLPVLERKIFLLDKNFKEKLSEFRTNVVENFGRVILNLDSFGRSCRRIQDKEVEALDLLQHIAYEMGNRSAEDMYRIDTRLAMQLTMLNQSLSMVNIATLTLANSTTITMKKVQRLLKQKDQCLMQVDDINWKVVDNICREVFSESPIPIGKLQDVVRSAISANQIEENILAAETRDSLPSRGGKGAAKGRRSGRNKDVDDEPALRDYDMDYPLSDAEYSD